MKCFVVFGMVNETLVTVISFVASGIVNETFVTVTRVLGYLEWLMSLGKSPEFCSIWNG